jgi:hypothetical protein
MIIYNNKANSIREKKMDNKKGTLTGAFNKKVALPLILMATTILATGCAGMGPYGQGGIINSGGYGNTDYNTNNSSRNYPDNSWQGQSQSNSYEAQLRAIEAQKNAEKQQCNAQGIYGAAGALSQASSYAGQSGLYSLGALANGLATQSQAKACSERAEAMAENQKAALRVQFQAQQIQLQQTQQYQQNQSGGTGTDFTAQALQICKQRALQVFQTNQRMAPTDTCIPILRGAGLLR